MRIPPLKVFGYVALAAPVFFAVMWIASATTDGAWQFGVLSLSDMGISKNPLSAFLFNFGCIATGICGMFIGFGMFTYGKKTLKTGGIIYMAGMFFLSLVGVFTLDNYQAHEFVASTFGLVASAAVLVSSVSDWRLSWYIYADVFLIVFSAIQVIAQPFAVWEAFITITAMIWIFIMGIKMLKHESVLFTDTPRIGGN